MYHSFYITAIRNFIESSSRPHLPSEELVNAITKFEIVRHYEMLARNRLLLAFKWTCIIVRVAVLLVSFVKLFYNASLLVIVFLIKQAGNSFFYEQLP